MSGPAIDCRGLGKRYRVATQHYELRDSLRDALASLIARRRGADAELWAVRDATFAIALGERVAFIGRNGAGKSTLLRLLARVTPPDSGEARIRGRVGSLLEIGCGFHPELTGRDNIFLYGSIIGMSRREIRARFADIAAFSGVDRFLDLPVKRYSSGMYLRLAFAVAAELDAEILLMDEVLAVGDALFAERCRRRLDDERGRGRTVVLVSHDLKLVERMCPRTIWLEGGRIVRDGPTAAVIEAYLVSAEVGAVDVAAAVAALPSDEDFALDEARIEQGGRATTVVANSEPVTIALRWRIKHRLACFRLAFDLCDRQGTVLFRSFHDSEADRAEAVDAGAYRSIAELPADLLAPHAYEIVVRAVIPNLRACIPEPGLRLPIAVRATGRVDRAYAGEPVPGLLQPRIAWETRRLG